MAAAGSLGTLFLGTAGFRALAARRGAALSISDIFRAAVGEGAEDPPLDKAIARVMPILERFYGFSGLETFKNKFDPV